MRAQAQYQVGMLVPIVNDATQEHTEWDPITDQKKASDLAEQIGVQITEAVDAENGQWLAWLPVPMAEALEKCGSLEITVEVEKYGMWQMVAEMSEGPAEE